MTNQTSLEDLLSDRELPETTEEAEQTEDTGEETSEETATAETEQETEEKDDSTPESKAEQKTADEEGPESWTKAAALDERKKRQVAEGRVEQLEQRLRELEAGGQQHDEQKPDWYGDPEKAAQAMQQQVGQTVSQQVWQTKVGLSQDMMRAQHEDYDELESEFMDLVKEQPGLIQEMQQAANPARFAYETAKKAREYTAMKDVDSYKAKLRQEVEAELRKELEAEQQQKAEKQQRKRDAIDPSLASSTSNGLKSDDYAGPTPLEDILN